MKIKYFQDTDTHFIEFRAAEVAETKDLDENTPIDLDSEGKICAITVEHASDRDKYALFELLAELDPQIRLGQLECGLERISTPEGEYLWLCNRHKQEYTI